MFSLGSVSHSRTYLDSHPRDICKVCRPSLHLVVLVCRFIWDSRIMYYISTLIVERNIARGLLIRLIHKTRSNLHSQHKSVSMHHHARKENARTTDQGCLLSSSNLLHLAIPPYLIMVHLLSSVLSMTSSSLTPSLLPPLLVTLVIRT